jgi:nitronate monooxygenase
MSSSTTFHTDTRRRGGVPESLLAQCKDGCLRLPVIAAPMFLASTPRLVIECCRAGIVGTLPALNARTTAQLDEWLTQIDNARVGPYGVNLIVHKTNTRLEADLKVIIAHEVALVITSLGAVSDIVDQIHAYDGVVFHDVINVHHARKAAEAGVDGLILVSAGAGGHAGTTNPFALCAEVRAFFDGTLLIAGAISTGGDVAAVRAMGADLAYIGTRFLATDEAEIDDRYKRMIVISGSSDILYTREISGVHANFLKPSIGAAGLDPDNLGSRKHEIDFGKELSATKAWKDIWSAGHGVGAISRVVPVAELVAQLEIEYADASTRLANSVTDGIAWTMRPARTAAKM